MDKVTVALTGDFSVPRSELIEKINNTENARYVSKVAEHTDYLVAARFDTVKARRAADFGVAVIDELALTEYLDLKKFPKRVSFHSDKPHWPTITWRETAEDSVARVLKYLDAHGRLTQRFVWLSRYGHDENGQAFFEAFDGTGFKTFREDRVIDLYPPDPKLGPRES